MLVLPPSLADGIRNDVNLSFSAFTREVRYSVLWLFFGRAAADISVCK